MLHNVHSTGLQFGMPFRYTIGGIYLARYTDSPVGPFDEVRLE